LTDATSGHVRFAPGEEAEPAAEEDVAAPSLEEVAAPAAEAVPPPAPALDADQVYSIVHRVVVKMSPPAFPPQAVEDMARKFTDEILSEGDG
jgi:hypothetical protein